MPEWKVITGRVEDVLPTSEPESFDCAFCDPPYGLTANKRGGSGASSLNLDSPAGRSRISTGGSGFMGKEWDARVPGPEIWREVLRCLKPGAFLLAFGGTRTFHRLACAIEDAGFEIRDCCIFLHGQGFPKSLDISAAIDKAAGAEREETGRVTSVTGNRKSGSSALNASGLGAVGAGAQVGRETLPATDAARTWEGYGSALKPAWEPCIVAMKPLAGTFAANALRHGVAGLNVDGCRIEPAEGDECRETPPVHRATPKTSVTYAAFKGEVAGKEVALAVHPLGRWPANVILGEEAAELLDRAVGETRGGEFPANNRAGLGYHGGAKGLTGERVVLDPGGPSRFFFTSKVRPEERNMGLQSTETIIVQSSPWNSETPEEIARLSIDMAQSPPRVTAVSGTRFKDGTAWSTFLFGSETSGLSLLGSTSTIETNGSSTTMSRILSWFLRSTTRECTPRTTAEGLPENGKSSAQTAKSGNPQRLSFGISRAAASGPTDTANPVGFAEWLRESKSVDLVFEGAGNRHATLKPLDLCEYLARLILPPKRPDAPRRLLVPFSGAGSEICGALEAGWEDVVGIEMEEQSAEWARARIAALLSTNPAERKGRRDDAGQVLQRGLFE